MKICEGNSLSARRELAAYSHLRSLRTPHAGSQLTRQLIDDFKVKGRSGVDHLCFIHEPLGMSLETMRSLLPQQQLTEGVLKSIMKYLFLTLDYLHTKAEMVHTGKDLPLFMFPILTLFARSASIKHSIQGRR